MEIFNVNFGPHKSAHVVVKSTTTLLLFSRPLAPLQNECICSTQTTLPPPIPQDQEPPSIRYATLVPINIIYQHLNPNTILSSPAPTPFHSKWPTGYRQTMKKTSQRKGRAPQPSITFTCQAGGEWWWGRGGGGPPR